MIVKHCKADTGVVVSKIALADPSEAQVDSPDTPTTICALSPDVLLLGTDSGSLCVFDIRQNGAINPRPVRRFRPHSDYVSSLVPLPPSGTSTSGVPKQWVSTGETTVAYTDLRKGVVKQSEDQEDELLCAALVPRGLGPKKNRDNSVLLVGANSGVVTMWDYGSWDDQQDRINVCTGGKGSAARGLAESIDALVYVPEELGWGHYAMAGASNGLIYQVNLKKKAVESVLKHDDEDGVSSVVMDANNRMISGGGLVVKIWEENMDGEDRDEDKDSDDEEEPSSNEARGQKRSAESDSSDGGGEDSDDSDSPAGKRKKKKGKTRGKKWQTAGPAAFPGID